jgi:hypothetical protein
MKFVRLFPLLPQQAYHLAYLQIKINLSGSFDELLKNGAEKKLHRVPNLLLSNSTIKSKILSRRQNLLRWKFAMIKLRLPYCALLLPRELHL